MGNRRVGSRSAILFLAVLLAFLLGSGGCAVPRTEALRSSLLPPPPGPAAADPSTPPPAVEPGPYPKETPAFLDARLDVPPRPSRRIEAVMKAAELHFLSGRERYMQGDLEEARAEFDQAIDTILAYPDGVLDRQALEKQLETLVETIHRLDVAGLGASDPMDEPGFDKSPLDEILELTFPVDPKLKNQVRQEVMATASQLPLAFNDAVLSYVNYFSGRGRKILLAGLRRAGAYRPMVQRILEEEGVPQELIHLAQAESGFMPRAVSRKRATGMWQFMQSRGREYGLMQDRYTDDRLDPEKATRAAARHLRDLYEQFGDWWLALAAYNCGPVNVEKAVQRTGFADFWELRSRNVLPKETANYVPAILAMTIMAKNPADYGLEEVVPDPPIEFDSVPVASLTHLALVADAAEVPLSEIRALNPAVLKNVVPAGYQLRVPKGSGPSVSARLDAVPAEHRASWRLHRVGETEGLAAIARRYKVSVGSITAANRLNGDGPEAGSLLLIPAPRQAEPAPRRTVAKRAVRRASSKRVGPAARAASAVRPSGGRKPAKIAPVATTASALRPGASGGASRR